MEIIGMVLLVIGGIIGLIGGIWLLIEQFKTGILWGLACIFVPLVSLIWLVMHWDDGKKPFLVSLVGVLLMFPGIMMSGGDASTTTI